MKYVQALLANTVIHRSDPAGFRGLRPNGE